MGKLIIVTGFPGSGKTTLSKKIAGKFSIPSLNKDNLKELIGDGIKVSSREESKLIGVISYKILDHLIEVLLKADSTFLIESNFPASFYNEKFTNWREKYQFSTFEIVCETDPNILYKRVLNRIYSNTRHPVHVETEDIKNNKYKETLKDGKIPPITIDGEIYHLETSNFEEIDYGPLFKKIAKFLKS